MNTTLKNPNVTYVFTHKTMLEALGEWEQEQIKSYPNQKERIQITVLAMQHFLRSSQVKDHKMIISGNPENFELKMPASWKFDNTEEE